MANFASEGCTWVEPRRRGGVQVHVRGAVVGFSAGGVISREERERGERDGSGRECH